MLLVTAAIIARGDRILIAQRSSAMSLSGQWEFPGGKVEAGEDPRNALVRECREELGCEVEVGAIYETIFHPTPDRDILLLFYLARIVSGEPAALEHSQIAWSTTVEMRSYAILPADVPLIARFEKAFPVFKGL